MRTFGDSEPCFSCHQKMNLASPLQVVLHQVQIQRSSRDSESFFYTGKVLNLLLSEEVL